MNNTTTEHLAMDGGDIPLIGHQPLIQINTKRPHHGQGGRVVVIEREELHTAVELGWIV